MLAQYKDYQDLKFGAWDMKCFATNLAETNTVEKMMLIKLEVQTS